MTTAMAMPGNTAATFLVHFFGGGLEDERYVVERFKAMANGDIRRMPGDGAAKKGRKARCVTAMVEGAVETEPETTVPPWHLQPAKPRCTPISRIPPTSGEIHQPINVTKTTAPLSS